MKLAWILFPTRSQTESRELAQSMNLGWHEFVYDIRLKIANWHSQWIAGDTNLCMTSDWKSRIGTVNESRVTRICAWHQLQVTRNQLKPVLVLFGMKLEKISSCSLTHSILWTFILRDKCHSALDKKKMFRLFLELNLSQENMLFHSVELMFTAWNENSL